VVNDPRYPAVITEQLMHAMLAGLIGTALLPTPIST
jgi:hypothetical protein